MVTRMVHIRLSSGAGTVGPFEAPLLGGMNPHHFSFSQKQALDCVYVCVYVAVYTFDLIASITECRGPVDSNPALSPAGLTFKSLL
jgi:hypothetical protein